MSVPSIKCRPSAWRMRVALYLVAAVAVSACGGGGEEDVSRTGGATVESGRALETPEATASGSEAPTEVASAVDAAASDVQVIAPTASAVAELIAKRAGGLKVVSLARVIEGDEARPAADGEVLIKPMRITYDAANGTVVVLGDLGGNHAVEDIRFFEHEGALHVIRDLYPAAADATSFAGRSVPALLAAQDGGSLAQRNEDMAVAMAAPPSSARGEVTAAAAKVPVPVLTSLGGVTNSDSGISNGRVAMGCGKLYNGAMAINDATGTYAWTIKGLNFGASAGKVTVAGRNAKVLSWSASQIKVDPTVPVDWGPISTTFVVQTSAGVKSTFGVGIAPAIKSRIFGQCTNLVARARLKLGMQPSPTAYGGYAAITSSYVPKAGDQFHWSGQHTAIVLSVRGPVATAGGYKTYTLTVSEQNAACTNAVTTYTTTFQTQTTAKGTAITARPISWIRRFANVETVYYR